MALIVSERGAAKDIAAKQVRFGEQDLCAEQSTVGVAEEERSGGIGPIASGDKWFHLITQITLIGPSLPMDRTSRCAFWTVRLGGGNTPCRSDSFRPISVVDIRRRVAVLIRFRNGLTGCA